MNLQFGKKQYQWGFSTLEMLLALALVAMVISAVTLVVFGNNSLAEDSQTNSEALYKAQELLDNARETSRQNFDSVVPATANYVNGITYTTELDIPLSAQSKCGEQAVSRVTWTGEHGRALQVELAATLTNVPEMLALGGACDTAPSSKTWNPPATWASSNFNPGKPTGLAALNRIVYVTGDKSPFLYITDTSGSTFGQSSGLFVNFANGFDDGAKLNDVAVSKSSNGRVYAYVARDTTTNQFEVIDVTDIHNPFSVVQRSLAGVDPTKSYPQGFRIYYYDNKVYVINRETTGPELHIFNAATPGVAASVTEIASKELNRTVEDFEIVKQAIAGSTYYIAYMASDKNTGELSVYNVTNPFNISEITTAEPVFSGNQDGASVFVTNGKLYFGRLSSSGPDIYVFNIANPMSGTVLPTLAQKDIGTSALGLVVSGQFLFVATEKTNSEFQVFNSSTLSVISEFNFPNVITNGTAYEKDWVYVASEGNDALRILYSPN